MKINSCSENLDSPVLILSELLILGLNFFACKMRKLNSSHYLKKYSEDQTQNYDDCYPGRV